MTTPVPARGTTRPARSPVRRALGYTAAACAAAAAVALFAASRVWLVETALRAAPLPPVTTSHSGGSLAPAVPALAFVALAGAGGLLATRAWGRRLVAALVLAAGLGLAALAAANLDRPGIAVGWVLLASVAGLVTAATGGLALARGSAWPGLGARYDRRIAPAPAPAPAGGPGVGAGTGSDVGDSDARGGSVGGAAEIAGRRMWDAIDRGEDPTQG